jgi:hypothetical protein
MPLGVDESTRFCWGIIVQTALARAAFEGSAWVDRSGHGADFGREWAMYLWSDYEGQTIDGAYPLRQLIRPEGRSAFFSTSTGAGDPAVIRLTEAVNDQDEILERWRQVSALGQEHLVAIKKYGQTRFDSVPLTFALMEPNDGSLAEILKERPLTPAEAREVATSLVDALEALHGHDLVHEHVEAANVLAVGDVVKLRSDCVRECKVDSEFVTQEECDRLRQVDVQGLATILLQALTLEKTLQPGVRLPAPFDAMVRHGLDGSWGLAEIAATLNPPVVSFAQAAPVATEKRLVPESVQPAAVARALPPVETIRVPKRVEHDRVAELMGVEWRDRVAELWANERVKRWTVIGAAAIVVLLVGWRLMGRSAASAATGTATAPAATAPATAGAYTPISQAPVGKPSAADSLQAAVATVETQPGWHVVAFTYRKQTQAEAKASQLRERHPALNPEVFAPRGRAPFYVSLGGGTTEREANVLERLARKDGLPRDTFVRRF